MMATDEQHQRSSRLPATVARLEDLVAANTQFPTIYADPPWRYNNTAARGAAENHYSTMSIDDLCSLPVARVAADNAHLHLWTTNSHLPEAFRVIESWGFTYKSCLVWIKPQMGMGNYWRVSHEYLLLGIRGRLPFRNNAQCSWVKARRRRHSVKPHIVRELIEQVSPGPYLEMFGRVEMKSSPWTVFGNQVERRLF